MNATARQLISALTMIAKDHMVSPLPESRREHGPGLIHGESVGAQLRRSARRQSEGKPISASVGQTVRASDGTEYYVMGDGSHRKLERSLLWREEHNKSRIRRQRKAAARG